MKDLKKTLCIITAAVLLFTIGLLIYASQAQKPGNKEDDQGSEVKTALAEYWTEDSQAAESLRAYVEKVTDPDDTENFIPVKDRIAVFDMDGAHHDPRDRR